MSSPTLAYSETSLPKLQRLAPARSWSRAVAVDLVGFADTAVLILGAFVPALIYAVFGELRLNWGHVLQSSLVAAFVGHLVLRDNGFYDASRLHELPVRPLGLAGAVAVAILCVVGLGIPVVGLQTHMLIWYASWMSASLTGLIATRWISARILARLAAAGRFDRRVAVYGAGAIATRVRDQLARDASGLRFAGLYDDRIAGERRGEDAAAPSGTLDDLVAAAQDQRLDDIIIALPQEAVARAAHILRTLERAPCNVHIVTHIAADLVGDIKAHRVSQIAGVGLLDVKRTPLADWAPIVKRTQDVIVAAMALIMTSPILAAAIVAIKLETRGPAFYVQRRRGLNGRVIEVLKLRTLSVAESDAEVRQVTEGDTRVTRVGRILRRTSIDELPQLWNVLRGDMSIVGPRPHALVHDDQFSSMLEEYANRHQVKPGITGLAQVNGLRGQTETLDKIKARVDCDIAYIRSWSLWLDLSIIARTAYMVLLGRNAH